MTFEDDSFDTEYFENFLNQVRSHEDWNWRTDSWPTFDEAVETASEARTAEIELVHPSTDTLLYAQVPSEDHRHVLTGRTRQSLISDPHPNQVPGPDSFEHQLAEAYQAIAEDHTTDYLAPAGRPGDLGFDLHKIQVPADYDSSKLQTALSEMGAAADEAYKLNQEIKDPVQQYLD